MKAIMLSMDKTDCSTFKWKIDNFRLFSLEAKNGLRSPAFKTVNIDGASWWRLFVYFTHWDVEFRLILYKGRPENHYKYEISLLGTCSREHAVPLKSKGGNVFIHSIDSIEDFVLADDTLTVNCKIWQDNTKPEHCLFHTVLHMVDFFWIIYNYDFSNIFRTLHEQENLQLIILLYELPVEASHQLRIELQPNEDGFPSFVYCKVSTESDDVNIVSSKSISPAAGWLCHIDISQPDLVDTIDIPLEFKALVAVEMKAQLLSPEHLPLPACTSEADPKSSIKEDFLLLYREGLHSDAVLESEGKSILVHKSILASRSPVFRAKFEKDQTSEALSGVVRIEDVSSKTLDQMLVFLYGECLEDLPWEEACALYYAADKYAVDSLKIRCVNMLAAGLNVSNMCQLLVLADDHVDEQLMKVGINFIREHDKVMSSAEWAELEDSRSKLTIKILRELYTSARVHSDF